MTMKTTTNDLTTIGTLIPDDDLLQYVIDGLSPCCKPFLTTLSMRPSLVTFDELHVLLLTKEDLLK